MLARLLRPLLIVLALSSLCRAQAELPPNFGPLLKFSAPDKFTVNWIRANHLQRAETRSVTSGDRWRQWVAIEHLGDTLVINVYDTTPGNSTTIYIGGPIDTVLRRIDRTTTDTVIHVFDSLGWPLNEVTLGAHPKKLQQYQYRNTPNGLVQVTPQGYSIYFNRQRKIDSMVSGPLGRIYHSYDSQGREIEEVGLLKFQGSDPTAPDESNDTLFQERTEYLPEGGKVTIVQLQDSTLHMRTKRVRYNSMGNIVGINVLGDSSHHTEFAYDSVGRLVRGNFGSDSVQMVYGSKGELLKTYRTSNTGVSHEAEMRYFYETTGR